MISIQLPQLADAPAIARCHLAAWRDSYRPLIADEILSQPSVEQDYVAKWAQRIQEPSNLVFVVQDGPTKTVGFILGGRERTGRSDYLGEIYLAYVLSEYRGRGIGRKLFRRLAEALLDRTISSAIVWVFEENPCRHRYAAWGGEQIEAGPIKVGQQDLVEMAYAWKDLRMLTAAVNPELA